MSLQYAKPSKEDLIAYYKKQSRHFYQEWSMYGHDTDYANYWYSRNKAIDLEIELEEIKEGLYEETN